MNPRISVIVPVLREASVIGPFLRRLRRLPAEGPVECLVVDGAPGADTLAVLGESDAIRLRAPRGRGVQMNAGAARASGETLLFLHADTALPANAFSAIAEALADPRVAGGAFDLSIDSPRPVFRVMERTASLRSRLTRIPYGDQAIFLRRSVFAVLGGYRPIPIMEDVDLMARLRRAGFRIRILPDRVRTSPRRWLREGIVRGTLRNWTIATLFGLGVPPERLVRYYR